MPKRKRAVPEAQEATKTVKQNPFLRHHLEQCNGATENSASNLVSLLIEFGEVIKNKSSDPGPTIEKLLQHIQNLTAGNTDIGSSIDNQPVSSEKVCYLLLPWTIGNILGSAQATNPIAWKCLDVCLGTLMGAKRIEVSVSRLTSSILTQSKLFKLVPHVAKAALSLGQCPEASEAASAFSCLTKYLFKPTLEVYVTILLLPLSCEIEKIHGQCEVASSIVLSMLELGLSLILSGKGNPKTTFQLFARKTSLIAVGRIQKFLLLANEEQGQLRLRRLLEISLFDPKHHMDGLRSLLKCCRITYPEIGETRSPLEGVSTLRMYQRDLFTGIVETFEASETDQSRAYLVVLFPLVWGAFIRQSDVSSSLIPQRKSGKIEERLHFNFAMFTVCYSGVHRHLSCSDIHDSLLAISALRSMLQLVDSFEVYMPSHDPKDEYFAFMASIYNDILLFQRFHGVPDVMVELVWSLSILLDLNHRFIHRDLPDYFRLCSKTLAIKDVNTVRIAIAQVFHVYRKLRRQSSCIDALFGEMLQLEKWSEDDLRSLCFCFKQSTIQEAFTMAFFEAPDSEIGNSFSTLCTFLSNFNKAKRFHEDKVKLSGDVILDVVDLFCSSLRVDGSNSHVISDHCRNVIDRSIELSLEDTSRDSISLGMHIRLSCSLLQLSDRCAFWLSDKGMSIDVPDHLLKLLHGPKIDSASITGKQLVPVSLYRLRQIQGISNKPVKPGYVERLSSESEQLTRSVLGTFLMNPYDRQVFEHMSQNFHFWVPHAKSREVKTFLDALLGSLLDEINPSSPESMIAVPFGISRQAMNLLLDESFFEHENVCCNIILSTLEVISNFLRTTLCSEKGFECMSDFLSEARMGLSVPLLDEQCSLTKGTMLKVEGSVRIVGFLPSFPTKFGDIENCRSCFVMLSNISVVYDTLLRIHNSPTLFMAIEICRETSSKALLNLPGAEVEDLLESNSASVSELMKSIVGGPLCSSPAQDARGSQRSSIQVIEKLFETLLMNEKRVHECTKIFVSMLEGHFENLSMYCRGLVVLHCSRFFRENYSVTAKLCSLAEASIPKCSFSDHSGADYFVGSLIHEIYLRNDRVGPIAEKLLRKFEDTQVNETCYLFNRLVEISPVEVLLRGWDRTCEHVHNLSLPFVAVFKSRIDDLEEAMLSGIIDRIICRSVNATVGLELFLCCCQFITSPSLIETLRRRFDEISLAVLSTVGILSVPDESYERNLTLGCEIFQSLLDRRDIHIYDSSELAAILSKMCRVISVYVRRLAPVPVHFLRASFRLYQTMMQRYARQLYTCAPVVVSYLRRFLDMILSLQANKGSIEMFTRMCEAVVTHRDIYKKHLVGLVLRFVRALEDGLATDTKDNMFPAISFLLDSLEEHEMKELNSMMDVKGRTLFRSIYGSYRKNLYRGH